MKHTPGPWSIIPDSLEIIAKPQTGLGGRFIAQALESVIREEGEPIDAIFIKEDIEAPANARLIASAPEMLSLIESISLDPYALTPDQWATEARIVIDKIERRT